MVFADCLYCKKEFRKREEKRKFCSLYCSNNFNKNGLKKTTLPIFSYDLAEFVGICLGDGCVAKYQTSITLNTFADKDYIPYVIKLINKLFPQIHPHLVKRRDNATDIRINSTVIGAFLKEMGIVPNKKIIPLWIFSSDVFRRACVKGLVDTEGSISFKRYLGKKGPVAYKQLNFRNYDIHFMKFVRDTLLEIGLKPTMILKKSLYISNDLDIVQYRELVGFGNPKLENKSRMILPIA